MVSTLKNVATCIKCKSGAIELQSTPLNRVTLVPEHFDPIKRNLGVDPIKRSELILFLWFCSWPSDPINRWPKLNR